MNILTKFVVSLAVCITLNACGAVKVVPLAYTPGTAHLLDQSAAIDANSDVLLPVAVKIRLDTGYYRNKELAAQSRWRRVGRLPEGNVYRPVASVFSVEGRQVHEAYLVVRDNMLVGFYLPVESAFSPLEPAIQLPQGVFP